MTSLNEVERNNYAVTLSEELDFLDALLDNEAMPVEVLRDVLTRRDIVREQLSVLGFAKVDDDAVQGIPLPSQDARYAELPDESEEDEEWDAVVHMDEDEDHEYSPNRANDPAKQRCTICHQPEAACTEEP